VCCELLERKQPADGRQSSRQTFSIQKIIVVERKKLIIISKGKGTKKDLINQA